MSNSILVSSRADPWVVKHNDEYYYCRVDNNDSQISVAKAPSIESIGRADRVPVWQPSKYLGYQDSSRQLWAPELHYTEGRWYIYFAASDGDNRNHRMYVLQAKTDDPQGTYEFKGKIASSDDHWAIDGTVLSHENQLYCIWSGWEGIADIAQNLYIAAMSNPWSIVGPRCLLSQPTFPWEHSIDPPINEGPEVLKHGALTYVVYSAASSQTDDACLGQLRLVGDNVLDSKSWLKHPHPVFQKTKAIYGPGHASFVKSADESQDWIIYHTARSSGSGYDRQVRGKQFHWNDDGSPNFGLPG